MPSSKKNKRKVEARAAARMSQSHPLPSAPPSATAHLMVEAVKNLQKRVDAVEKTTDAKDGVLIPDPGKDKKESVKALPFLHQSLLKRAARIAGVRVRVPAAVVTATSAANTAFTTVQNLTPVAAPDAVTYAGVYDICRTIGFEVILIPFVTTTVSGAPTNAGAVACGALAYDSANAGAYSTLAEVLGSNQYLGPWAHVIGPLFDGHKGGIIKAKWRVPRPVVDPGLVTDLLDSNWVATSDTSVLVGYLKPYLEAAGGALSTVLRIYVIYDMEFRARS